MFAGFRPFAAGECETPASAPSTYDCVIAFGDHAIPMFYGIGEGSDASSYNVLSWPGPWVVSSYTNVPLATDYQTIIMTDDNVARYYINSVLVSTVTNIIPLITPYSFVAKIVYPGIMTDIEFGSVSYTPNTTQPNTTSLTLSSSSTSTGVILAIVIPCIAVIITSVAVIILIRKRMTTTKMLNGNKYVASEKLNL